MKVLVINSGSSSIKYKVFDCDDHDRVLVKGIVERIGLPNPVLKCNCDQMQSKNCHDIILCGGRNKIEIPDHVAALNLICKLLLDERCPIIKDLSEIAGVGHRVVHGGEYFSAPELITTDVIEKIRLCARLAPLHNPPAIRGIEAVSKAFPGVPQVAVFDTAFHHTIPQKAYMYGIAKELYTKHGIRKYGFHGISVQHAVERFAALTRRPRDASNLVVLHLGSGCSVTAVRGGRSVDTSMGFTPLEGLVMGTRSGDVDPGLLLYLLREGGMSVEALEQRLNRESGLLGLSRSTADARLLVEAAAAGDARADFALDVFAYRARKYIGAYLAVLGRVDAVVFTGGIGEHQPEIRRRIIDGLEPLGIGADPRRNAGATEGDASIGAPGGPIAVEVIAADEERVLAAEARRLMHTGSDK